MKSDIMNEGGEKRAFKERVMRADEQDKRVLEIALDMPKTHKVIAVLCFCINFVIPGFGTIIASLCTYSDTVPKTQLAIGALQFVTSWVIIGWIISIFWGYLILLKAYDYDEKPPPITARGSTASGIRGGGSSNRQKIANDNAPGYSGMNEGGHEEITEVFNDNERINK